MYDLLFFFTLIALGYGVGTIFEKRHYRSIKAREKAFLALPAVTLKSNPYPEAKILDVRLVTGSAVISVDHFKRLVAGLRNIFGGTVKSYESLLDRARREAVLRMKEAAGEATVIVNLRIETATIGKNAHKKGVGCLEAIAYGTALTLKKDGTSD
jgi:uncharacterized protein YbjQ (UPF0145 family)